MPPEKRLQMLMIRYIKQQQQKIRYIKQQQQKRQDWRSFVLGLVWIDNQIQWGVHSHQLHWIYLLGSKALKIDDDSF